MPSDKSRRSRRRKRDEDEDDDYDEGGGFGGWKLGLVIGVIVVCFAVVYPHVFHPLIMSFLGKSDPPPSVRHDRPPMHPGMAGRGPAGSRGPGADAHPAMRMAAAQAEAQGGKGGGARSIYTFMIPIYTVGVIAFLLYTMFKSKKNKKRRRHGEEDDYSDEEVEERRGGGRKPLAGRKMRDLQERLRQTEDAMSKILTQLEKAQSEGKLTPEMMANLGGEEEEEETKKSSKGRKSRKDAKVEEKSKKNAAKPLPDDQTTQYMEDLEKALADFKELSDLYEDAKGGKRRKEASDSEGSDSEDSLSDESQEEEEEEVDQNEEEEDVSSSHPFPVEDKVKIEEIEDQSEEEEEEEPAREPTPPPPPSPPKQQQKARRRKPQKI